MKFTKKLADFIVNSRWLLFGLFIALAIICVFLVPQVKVNYDMTKYLPNSSETKIALNVMQEEYGSIGTASVMITQKDNDGHSVSIPISEVNALVEQIKNIDGVASAVFDSDSSTYYKDGKALVQIFFTTGSYDVETSNTIQKIQDVCNNYEVYMSGQAIDGSSGRTALGSEVVIILAIAVVIVLGILTLTSKSWLEPLVYLIVIGIAILMNMGSNLILGEISFITQSISTIMLIALEMDYCIVLCSRFREEESKGKDAITAMKDALAGSFTAIIASSLTVIAGLVALMFMQYSIGFDIGAVLAKGVFISILAVVLFMPSVILLFSKLMNKTKHKSFLPKMDKVGSFANKTKWILPLVFVAIIAVSAVVQTGVNFSYINESSKEGSVQDTEKTTIEQTFGKQNSLVVIIPNNNLEKEKQLFDEIANITVEVTKDDGSKEQVKYVTIKKGAADTILYNELTIPTLQQFNIDEESANAYLQTIKTEKANQLGISVDNVKVYVYDLIQNLHNNQSIIPLFSQFKQNKIDEIYNQLAEIKFKDKGIYENISLADAISIYTDLSTTSPTVTSESLVMAIYSQILEQADLTSTLPHYALITGIANMISDPATSQFISDYYKSYIPLYFAENAPLELISFDNAIAGTGLSSEVMTQIFSSYNLNPASDSIETAQLFYALHTPIDQDGNTIITKIGLETQKTINSYYNDLRNLVSDNYSRMIFNLSVETDDENAKIFINKLNEILSASDYEEYYIINETSNLMETEQIFSVDKLQTDLIIIFGILLIVLIAFRSLSLPIILVLTIQGAIWINIAISTVMGESIFFVCYLLAMAIQMGATIDYGILLSDRYKTFRKQFNKVDSIKKALNASLPTIITSGSILIIAPLLIHFISSMPVISEIGLLVGRGALISVIAILFILPQLLLLFDKVIEKTSFHTTFYKEVKAKNVKKETKKVTATTKNKSTTKKSTNNKNKNIKTNKK